jgi:hypothetical protein
MSLDNQWTRIRDRYQCERPHRRHLLLQRQQFLHTLPRIAHSPPSHPDLPPLPPLQMPDLQSRHRPAAMDIPVRWAPSSLTLPAIATAL